MALISMPRRLKFNLGGNESRAKDREQRIGLSSMLSIITPSKITLSKYTNVLLTRFAGGGGVQVSPTAFKTKGIEWARWNPVGTGPYEFVSFERDVRTKYKRFEGYWQKGKPYLDGVEYRLYQRPMTQAAAMQAGEAQVLNTETGKWLPT